MKIYYSIITSILFLGILLIALGCKKDDEGMKTDDPTPPVIENPNPNPEMEVPTIIPNGDEQYLEMDSDYIFDQEKLATYELVLPDAALAKIDANPAAEEYVEGMLIFEGDTVSPVGIRYKGSIGAFVGCLSGTDWNNPSGHKTCTKLSMKVKINWGGREEKFFKLKKLQFHSQNLDDSKMRERLGYWLFRAMGVPGPRSVHARLMINHEYVGLFALTEQVDNRFVKYNFEDDEGNLYKEIWPLNSNGVPYSKQRYINALETNEEDNPIVDFIRNFGQSIADADPANVPNIIATFMDIDEVLSYAVVDRMIRHDDGPFHWYCSPGGCENHNYYWYEEPTNQQLHLIPWDLNNAFENIITNVNPVTPIADKWGEIRNNCQPFSYGTFSFRQKSAACDKLTGGWASFTEEYAQKRTAFKEGPFSEISVNALLDDWKAQIRAAATEASETHNDAISVASWEGSVAQLKGQLEFARNH